MFYATHNFMLNDGITTTTAKAMFCFFLLAAYTAHKKVMSEGSEQHNCSHERLKLKSIVHIIVFFLHPFVPVKSLFLLCFLFESKTIFKIFYNIKSYLFSSAHNVTSILIESRICKTMQICLKRSIS